MKAYLLIVVTIFSIHKLAEGQNNSPNEPRKYKGIGIVFGMSRYQNANVLPNTTNDADSIQDILDKIGFDSKVFKDSDLRTMDSKISDWGDKLKDYDVCLFYFSGHGAEIQGENYLFPVDAKVRSTSDAKFETYPLNIILGKIDDARNGKNSNLKTSIIILDACRNNPFSKSWVKSIGDEGGLAAVNAPNGTFIGFAASPGKVAKANGVNNSAYTEAILSFIKIPNLTIDQVFNKVNAKTAQLTEGTQIPFKNSSLDDDFYFIIKAKESIEKALSDIKGEIFSNGYINDFLKDPISLGSSLDNILTKEFGPAYKNSVKYSTLPIADECSVNPKDTLRYYWRFLNQSVYKNQVTNYLKKFGIDIWVNSNSYILYFFNHNKLYRKEIRFFYNDITFHSALTRSFKIDLLNHPDKFYYKGVDNFSALFLDPVQGMTVVAVGESKACRYCKVDWWYNLEN